MTTRKRTANRPRKGSESPPEAPGRRYPRQIGEAGDTAGDRRVVGLAALRGMEGALGDLRDAALEDLGGEANVSALRAEVLEIGLRAEWIATLLLAEITNKAAQSQACGRRPNISRYKATGIVATFLDLAARRFREVGLDRRSRRVDSYVAEVLEREAGRGRANVAAGGSGPQAETDRGAGADVDGGGGS